MFVIIQTSNGAALSMWWETTITPNRGFIQYVLPGCTLFSGTNIYLGAQSTLDWQSNIFRYTYSSSTTLTRQWTLYTHTDNAIWWGRIFDMTFDTAGTNFFMGGFHSFRVSGTSFNNWMSITKVEALTGTVRYNFGMQINTAVNATDFSVRSIAHYTATGYDHMAGCGLFSNSGTNNAYIFSLKVSTSTNTLSS